jgi:hypothetical protein
MIISNKYQYKLELEFPDIEYKTNLIPYFLIIKQPIFKYSAYILAGILVNDKVYYDLIKYFNTNKKIDAYLTITTIKNDYSCKVIGDNDYKKWNVVEKKKLTALRITKIDEIPSADDRLGYNLFHLVFVDTKSLELDNDYLYAQQNNVWYNITISDFMKLYFDDILVRYQINSYEKIQYSNHKFDQIVVKQDISQLELPFFIQKQYKLSTGLPIIFHDPFSSYLYYKTMDVYKIYDLAQINKFIKADMSELAYTNLLYIKTENIDHPEITKRFTQEPNKLVLIYNDASTKVVDVSNKKSVNKAKFNDNNKKYSDEKHQIENPIIYNVHVFDNEQLTIERYNNTRDIFQKISGISRVRITGDYFLNYDIGVLYKFNRTAKYNSLFFNLCYYFYMLDTSSMTCDVVGDILEFQF